MPKIEKTLQGDLDEINKKIAFGVCTLCPMTTKRGTWDTTMGGVRCVMTVFEKHAAKAYAAPSAAPEGHEDWDDDYKPSWFNIYAQSEFTDQPHYSMTVTLLGDGSEVRLCAITAGSDQEHYFIPGSTSEGALGEALNATLDMLDQLLV